MQGPTMTHWSHTFMRAPTNRPTALCEDAACANTHRQPEKTANKKYVSPTPQTEDTLLFILQGKGFTVAP